IKAFDIDLLIQGGLAVANRACRCPFFGCDRFAGPMPPPLIGTIFFDGNIPRSGPDLLPGRIAIFDGSIRIDKPHADGEMLEIRLLARPLLGEGKLGAPTLRDVEKDACSTER